MGTHSIWRAHLGSRYSFTACWASEKITALTECRGPGLFYVLFTRTLVSRSKITPVFTASQEACVASSRPLAELLAEWPREQHDCASTVMCFSVAPCSS